MSNELNYVNYDFDDLMQQLIDRVKLRDAWKDVYRSGTGQMLIELYAYVANLVLYYVERRAEESYIDTAKLKSSVINLVRLLNYTPKRKTSSTGTLTFSIASPLTKKVFIPLYTKCETASGVKYLTNEEVVIMPGQTSVDAEAIQGEIIDSIRIASGDPNQEYTIDDTSVENTNLFVYVDGVLWTKVSSFVASTNVSTNYKVRTELDDKVTIVFGDNVFGKAPESASEVLIRYIRSDGIDGNVYESDKITVLDATIYDEDEAQAIVTVTNNDNFLGGDDAEDIEEIRYEAPRVFSTGDRAVTRSDFVAILENYAGVANANAWGENEESPPNYDMFNRVKLAILLQEWELPTDTFKSTLSTYLYTLSLITVKYEFITPTILLTIPTLDVKVASGNSLSSVESAIETALAGQFDLGNTTRLGTSKRISDLVHTVEAVTGAAYHHMILKIYKELTAAYDSFYDYGTTLDALTILPESIELYVGDTLVAVDDGAGGWTVQQSPYSVSGTINYTTGYLGADITPGPGVGEAVSVRYRQNESGDIVPTQNQICKLHEVDITSISYES